MLQSASDIFGSPLAHIRLVAFSTDGHRLCSCSTVGTIKVWDTRSGHTVHEIRAVAKDTTGMFWGISAAALSPDGLSACTGCDDGSILLWDIASGTHRTIDKD